MKTELTLDELGELYDLADAYAERFDEDPDDYALFDGLRNKLMQMMREMKGETT